MKVKDRECRGRGREGYQGVWTIVSEDGVVQGADS